MLKMFSPEQSLIVAADFEPDLEEEFQGRVGVRQKTRNLADLLTGIGVIIKLESVLPVWDAAVREMHNRYLSVMADLKSVGNPKTLARTAKLIRELGPEIVTVFCGTGLEALKAFKSELPETEVLGVAGLTSFTDTDAQCLHGCPSTREVVMRFVDIASQAKLDGVVCAPTEASMIRRMYGDTLSINVANIRLVGASVDEDDQNPGRSMTPEDAILAGADRIIVGRPIVRDPKPREAVMRVIEEVTSARVKLKQKQLV